MSHTRNSESGFTLAGLIVILTVMMIFIAYTVPKAWSNAVNRDRDQQTLFVMKQYARAIRAFQAKNTAFPVSLDQLKQARLPRLIRGKGEYIDPLTGKVDWILVPMGAQPGQPSANGSVSVGVGGDRRTGVTAGAGGTVVGPIIGVRPARTGESYLMVNGSDSYEQWSYTVTDLNLEIQQHMNALLVK